MQKQYIEDPDFYPSYYLNQAGSGLPIYGGIRIQRGYSLGGFFASLFRSSLPFLKHGARVIGKEALRSGLGVASDVLDGQNWKDSAVSRLKPGISRVIQRMQTGSGKRRGIKRKCSVLGAKKKKRTANNERTNRKRSQIKHRPVLKRTRRVSFGSDIFN